MFFGPFPIIIYPSNQWQCSARIMSSSWLVWVSGKWTNKSWSVMHRMGVFRLAPVSASSFEAFTSLYLKVNKTSIVFHQCHPQSFCDRFLDLKVFGWFIECPDNQMNIVPTCGNFDPENHTSTLGVIATAIWSLPGELYALDISKPPMLLPHVLPNLNMPTRAFGNFIGVKNPILPCLWVRKSL